MRTVQRHPDHPRIATAAILGAATPHGMATARRLALAGCRLLLSDHDEIAATAALGAVRAARPDAEAEILPCERTSCWEADLIVLAAPVTSRSHLLDRIRDVATGKIVLAVGATAEAGALLRSRLPHARLVLMSGEHDLVVSTDAAARAIVEHLLRPAPRADRRRPVRAA